MQFNGSVFRWRRKMTPDRYNPERVVPGTWADAEVVKLDGAAVLSTSGYALRTADRVQALEAKSLFLDDPAADVQRGDGISMGLGADEPEFQVERVPAADVNPFTGVALVREVPLTGVTG